MILKQIKIQRLWQSVLKILLIKLAALTIKSEKSYEVKVHEQNPDNMCICDVMYYHKNLDLRIHRDYGYDNTLRGVNFYRTSCICQQSRNLTNFVVLFNFLDPFPFKDIVEGFIVHGTRVSHMHQLHNT